MSLEHVLDALGGSVDDELVKDIKSVLADLAHAPSALARATALWVWKRQYEAEHPGARRGGDRKSAAYREKIKVQSSDFDQMAAEATGLSRSSIFADVGLAEQLGPDDIRVLWAGPIADNAAALRAVAALDVPNRGRLFSIWNDNPKLGFGAAMLAAKLRAEEDSEEAAFERLLDGWTRASTKARRRFLTEIGVPPAAAEAVIVKARKGGAK